MTPVKLILSTILLAITIACAEQGGAGERGSAPSPSPSHQPVPAPPIDDASAMRDQLLRVAREKMTTDTITVFGIHDGWRSVFPKLKFGPAGEPATTDTVSGGDAITNERENDLTMTVTFAVVDTTGRCAGGYISGQGAPSKFEPLDPSDACNGYAVYLVRNPEPEPEPEPPVRKRRPQKGSGSDWQPREQWGGVEQRPLGDTTVERKA